MTRCPHGPLTLATTLAAALVTSTTARAADAGPPTDAQAPATPAQPVAATPSAPDTSAKERRLRQGPRRGFLACNPGSDPCSRARPARLILALTGGALGGLATGLLLGLGDSLGGGDPAGLMIGAGSVGLIGAGVAAIAGVISQDRLGDSDRLRPATVGLALDLAGRPVLDEADPSAMFLRFAPTYWLSPGSRIRLFGHVGGLLGRGVDVDPRPQLAEANDGAFPATLAERRLSVGIGLDTAIALPYPILSPKRSSYLGRAELRWKPEVQIRRQTFAPGLPDDDSEELLERTMLLPLTVGMRWHLSSRQRFTAYIGPRFDFVAHRAPGDAETRRGAPSFGPIYGEAWYDIDVPIARNPDRVRINGQLSMGYVHARFDGRGFNIAGAIGFMGPFHTLWNMRFRPPRSRVAVQAGTGVIVGNGVAITFNLGIVTPDLQRRRPRRRPRAAPGPRTPPPPVRPAPAPIPQQPARPNGGTP